MDFSEALKVLKAGGKVRRKCWPGGDHIVTPTTTPNAGTFRACDVFADDWEVYQPSPTLNQSGPGPLGNETLGQQEAPLTKADLGAAVRSAVQTEYVRLRNHQESCANQVLGAIANMRADVEIRLLVIEKALKPTPKPRKRK
jgi:hypothetical protein